MHDVCPWPKKWRMSILPLLWYLKSSYRHNIGRERTRAQKKVLLISSLCPVLAKMCQGYKTPLLMPLDFVSQIRVIKICINNAISHKNSAILREIALFYTDFNYNFSNLWSIIEGHKSVFALTFIITSSTLFCTTNYVF